MRIVAELWGHYGCGVKVLEPKIVINEHAEHGEQKDRISEGDEREGFEILKVDSIRSQRKKCLLDWKAI